MKYQTASLKTIFLCLAAFLLAFPAGTATAQPPPPAHLQITQVDTSAFPQVKVYVSALNDAGEPVAIRADQITLTEDGTPIRPQDAHGIGNSEPLTTLLAVDVSGSMLSAGKLESAKTAARAFVEQMLPGEEAGLLSFNTQINYVQPVTADRSALAAAINRLRAERYNTSMYDALVRSEEILQPISGRKAIIVLTDGVDNQSRQTVEDVVQGVGASGLSISTIGLGEPSQGRATVAGLDESALQDLAAQSGGSYSYVSDATALRSLYEKLGKALQSEYVLTYTSPAQYRDGVSRSLSVSLGSMSAAGESAKTAYNPGGLIPEVPQTSTWPVFIVLMLGLVCLALAPSGLRWIPALVSSLSVSAAPQPKTAAPRIRLKESAPARIKIKGHE
jgi:Ca-activated chloride channel homolog